MATKGIEGLYLETHNWGKSVAFWQALGFKLEFETDHHSGLLRPPEGGPYIFLAERPQEQALALELYLRVEDASTCAPGSPVEVVGPFAATHWDTRVMKVRDPDGRVFSLQAPGG